MFAGSLRRSSQLTPTNPVGLTEIQGRNWSCVIPAATGTGFDHAPPPSVERTTCTCMNLPVQLYITTYRFPACGPLLLSTPIAGVSQTPAFELGTFPWLSFTVTIRVGAVQVFPPSLDLENTMYP